MDIQITDGSVSFGTSSRALVETLHLLLVLHPDSNSNRRLRLIWEFTLLWLIRDSQDQGLISDTLQHVGELAYFLSEHRPEDCVKLCQSWLPEAEAMEEWGHVDGLWNLIYKCEVSSEPCCLDHLL